MSEKDELLDSIKGMPGVVILDVTIPGDIPHCVWPNSRCHYMQRWKATQRIKTAARMAVLNAGPVWAEEEPYGVQWVVALGRGKRQRDLDNTVAACKALQDGVFDALGVDDKWVKQVGVQWTRATSSSVRCLVIALTRG